MPKIGIFCPRHGGVKISRKKIAIAVLLMMSMALLNVNYFCAATDEQGLEGDTAENLTENATIIDSNQFFNETSENSTNISTEDIDLNMNETTDDNTSEHENPQDNNSSVNILNINDESMIAAGGDSYDNVKGIWMWSSHINSLNVNYLLNSGITDIFLYVNPSNYQTNINSLLNKIKDTGIRVHAWISCFKDSDGKWIDPKDTAYTSSLLNTISNIVKNTDISGIHLDYVRYSGVGNNAAYKHVNGTETITAFVESVYNTVKSIKPKVAVSAALMPERSVNAYYYGQDYSQLSQFLDFLVPMIYKGNYKKDTDWIASTTKYIIEQANGKPVIAGIQTYRSDDDTSKISAEELNQDINAATNSGSSGYVLFRYGLIDENFWNDGNLVNPNNPVTFTIDQIKSAAVWVKSFVESNGRLPDSVTIGSRQVSMSQLLQLLTSSVLQISKGVTTPIKLLDVGGAPNPSGDLVSGNVVKSEYLRIASSLLSFMDSNGRAPNWGVYSLGRVQFDYLVYSYSKIMDFYATNKRLPNYAIINTLEMGSDSSIPQELLIYLQQTKNAQSTNATIIALARSITNGLKTNYQKADAIFRWVRDNISYSFYYNTKHGATGILKSRNGNCIDHSHLIVALSRAVGIPARYGHAQCKFPSMTVGHVWAELYVNGKWYIADATSSRNTLGVMQNCQILYLKGANGSGIWRELPF